MRRSPTTMVTAAAASSSAPPATATTANSGGTAIGSRGGACASQPTTRASDTITACRPSSSDRAGQDRIDRASEAAARHLYRAGRYEEAASLFRAAALPVPPAEGDASGRDEHAAVGLAVAMESTASSSAAAAAVRKSGGRGAAATSTRAGATLACSTNFVGIGAAGAGEQLNVDLDVDRILEMINRAATAHNLGLAQTAAAAAAATTATSRDPSSTTAATTCSTIVRPQLDPLPSYQRSAALYRMCHALVSNGRVRDAQMIEREALPSFLGVGSNNKDNDNAADVSASSSRRQIICAEMNAARSLLATAEALAQRSDVDGTIHCHEELVSFLLGDDGANDDGNENNTAVGGIPSIKDDKEDGDWNSLLDDGTSTTTVDKKSRNDDDDEVEADGDARGRSPGGGTAAGPEGDGDATADGEDGGGDGNDATAGLRATAPLFVTMNEHQRMRLISNSLNALGNLYSRRGDEEDAIVSFTDALDLLRSIENPVGVVEDVKSKGPINGSSRPTAVTIDIRDDIARTLLSLSTLHGRRGELDDAIDCGEEALVVLTERHADSEAKEENRGSPNRHPAVLSALHALGRLYDLDGDFDAAMSCYEDAFLGRCKTVGSDDICVADVLVDMSSSLQRTGNVDGALELNSQALRIYRLLLAQEGGEGRAEGGRNAIYQRRCKVCLAGTLQNRGSMYMEKNEYDEALICYADSMENLKDAKGEDHSDAAALWAIMGDANVVAERFDSAKDCYAAALEAHRMRGIEDTDSPISWMLQKIRVIEDIVASAHKEDDEFIEDLATRADDAPDDEKSPTRSTKTTHKQGVAAIEKGNFLNQLAAGGETKESYQQHAKRFLAQQQEDSQFMREIDAVPSQNNCPISFTNEQNSSLLQEEQAFLAELASGTMSDDDNNDATSVDKQQSPTQKIPILKKNSSFNKKTLPQVHHPRSTDQAGEIESVAGPAGIKEIIPRGSADDTVSLITFKEEAMLSNAGTGRRVPYKRQNVYRTKYSGGGKSQQADWLTNTLGNIVEQADNFLRPLAEHPKQSKDSSVTPKGQAPISEITFYIGGDGQEIARTRSADSDITDILDVHGSTPTSGEPWVSRQALEEEIGEEIGVEVDELLAQMASAEDDVDSPMISGDQTLEHRKPRGARISISSPTSAGSSVRAEHIDVSPRSEKSRKVAKTAQIKGAKKQLKRLKATKGTESAEVAACLMSLGSLYVNEADVDSALSVWLQELEVRRAVYGVGHFGVADVLNRIGTIRLERDEFELAKNCHTQALEIQQACLGEKEHNPDVSRTLVNIGNVYYKERNSLTAIKSGVHDALYEDVIESGMLCRIAFAHDERGEYVRAIHFYDEHVELLKSRGENKHIPGIINALNCLGSLNKKIGRYVEALDYHTKALNMQRAVPKIAKVELANTSVLIGMIKHKAGHFQKALSLFSDALPVQQKAYGKKHSIPGRTIFQMALAYDELADHKKAMSSLEQALSIQKSALPPDHPDTLSTRMYISRIHSSAGKFDFALTALLGVLNSQMQLYGPKHPLVADTLHQIGICYARKGKMNSALKTYEECFSIRKDILGYDHPDIASCLNSIAAVHASKKRNEKALPIYEAALKIRRDALGDQHVDVARTLSNQGVAYAALRDFDRAMAVYNEAKAIRKAALGECHPSVGDSHVNIGNVFLRKCAFSDARREFEAALLIYKKSNLPPCDPKLARTMAVIERVKRDEELCV